MLKHQYDSVMCTTIKFYDELIEGNDQFIGMRNLKESFIANSFDLEQAIGEYMKIFENPEVSTVFIEYSINNASMF